MPYRGQGINPVQRAVAAEPNIAGILTRISGQLDEIIGRLDAIGGVGGEEEVMSYDYLSVTVPANSNDYEVTIPVPASLTHVAFNYPVKFRLNEISATQIPWMAIAEFRISPMRTERLYVTTGNDDTTVSIRTVLTTSDMTRDHLRRRR